MYKKTLKLFIFFLSIFFLLSTIVPSSVTAANQNPPKEEIARIFEQVAQEKQIPAQILKAIAYTESEWRQWDSNGNVLASYWGSRPNLGIMQVSAYDANDTVTINKLKNDIAFNIAYGADVLKAKWDATPKIGNGDPQIYENWYFAIWAYNSWSTVNNPNNAKSAGREAYQDKILRLAGTDFYPGLINPIKITPIPSTQIPAGTLPSKTISWSTPEPFTYADFSPAVSAFSQKEIDILQSVNRIAGKDRIETAVKITQKGWPSGSETVIIAKSQDYPDALAGAALAKMYHAPILLTPSNVLDSRVEGLVKTLNPQRVIILGGTGAITGSVENKLKAVLNPNTIFERIGGKDRYETASMIADKFPAGSDIAIAAGHVFPDALSLSSASATQGIPLILVKKDNLPESSANLLKAKSPDKLYIAGGEGVISSGVISQIQQTTGIPETQIKRFSGKDRYETSSMVITAFYPDITKFLLATGDNFPDALAGSALAANLGTPMLLVDPQGPLQNSSTAQFLTGLSAKSTIELEVIGGTSAVTDKCILLIKSLLQDLTI